MSVELSHQLHPDEWARRHTNGEVPDHWPYGLDRLARHGVQPVLRPPRRGLVTERVGRAARHRLGGYEWMDALRFNDCDAVLCWDEYSGVPAALRERRKPVVTGVVWLTDEVAPMTARFARWALPRAELVWASSSAMIPRLRSDWGVRRAHHIPLGIDTDFFHVRPGSEPGLVVSAGNDRHRDHGMLVRAVRRVPGARLEIATRLPVDPAVARPGLSEGQIRGLYARASVVAIATTPNVHASGLTVTLEAMASGRPVVIPDTPGLMDYVVGAETGLVYPAGDEDELAKCVQRLLSDSAMAAELGAAGRRKVEREFSTELQAARLAELMLRM
ncbi:glycosyltransferase family 4 protein [Actinocrispum wychmicini]|uniref:glycosyltransferase family 4 protein n=1 Tax=Actinocrispum wychmicini TaxID=1213861 RepID=UPI00104410E8|nr:glycosyltransferase family 4 protein [Actinocrispum wychmicini]